MTNNKEELMIDEDATPLEWFLLECFARQLFGDQYELQKEGEAL